MKANELRIGNLIKVCDYEMSVTDIGTDGVLLQRNCIAPSGFFEFDQIKPIHLNKEWIEKFDWFSVDEDRYTFRDIEYYQISEEGSLYFNGRYTATEIKYVHQLQNLYFAITGSELELKEL